MYTIATFFLKDRIVQESMELLKELQGIDTILAKAENKKTAVPKSLGRLEKEHEQRKSELEKERSLLEKVNEQRRKVELKLKAEAERIQKSEEKITLVKTNKEYHAVQKEIEDIKKANGELETEILMCLEKADKLEDQLKEQQVKYEQWVQEFEKKKKELERDVKRSEEEAVILQQQRMAMLNRIDPSLLSRYERLKETRQGVAVVAITDGFCEGCNMNIPPQISIELQQNLDSIMHCPFCSRIIYINNGHG